MSRNLATTSSRPDSRSKPLVLRRADAEGGKQRGRAARGCGWDRQRSMAASSHSFVHGRSLRVARLRWARKHCATSSRVSASSRRRREAVAAADSGSMGQQSDAVGGVEGLVDQAVLVAARRPVPGCREGQRAVAVEQDDGVVPSMGEADQVIQFALALAAAGRADDQTGRLQPGRGATQDVPDAAEPVKHGRMIRRKRRAALPAAASWRVASAGGRGWRSRPHVALGTMPGRHGAGPRRHGGPADSGATSSR